MTGDNLYPSILETLDTDKYREFGEAYIRDTSGSPSERAVLYRQNAE